MRIDPETVAMLDRTCPICGSNFLIVCAPKRYAYQLERILLPDEELAVPRKKITHPAYFCRYSCFRKAQLYVQKLKEEKQKKQEERVKSERRAYDKSRREERKSMRTDL